MDLIHETLLRTNPKGDPYWPTLWERIEYTDFLATRMRLEQQAKAWHKTPNTVPLARGRELRVFLAHRPGADADTRVYLEASVRQQRHNRRFRRFILTLLALTLLVIAFIGEGALWLTRSKEGKRTQNADWSTLIARWRLWINWPDTPTLVKLPPESSSDCFQMGSPDGTGDPRDHPQHQVCLQAFYITQHEITFSQYDAFTLSEDKSLVDNQGWGRGDRPVINVDWEDAHAYARWLSDRTDGLTCDLPSEAEWEYAARAETETPYYWGTDEKKSGEFAWFASNSDERTHSVGEKTPNDFGLYDMAGNVWEWIEDCWHSNYTNAPKDGGTWREEDGVDCASRVLRGGSWYGNPGFLRSALRSRNYAVSRLSSLGFRLVCRPPSFTDR